MDEADKPALPAWDQSNGVVCLTCGDDATLCGHLLAGFGVPYTDELVTYALETSRHVDFDLRGALFAAILFFGHYNLALAAEMEE